MDNSIMFAPSECDDPTCSCGALMAAYNTGYKEGYADHKAEAQPQGVKAESRAERALAPAL